MNGNGYKSNYFEYLWYYHVSDMSNLENDAYIDWLMLLALQESRIKQYICFQSEQILLIVNYKRYEKEPLKCLNSSLSFGKQCFAVPDAPYSNFNTKPIICEKKQTIGQ